MTRYSITPDASSVSENTGTLRFTIQRSEALPAETLYVSTVFNEGFVNGGDYVGLLNRAVVFAENASTAVITLTINEDSAIEEDERFGIVLQRNSTDAANTYLARATFTILDNDGAPETAYSLSPAATTVNEDTGEIVFTVTRTGDLPVETVYLSTVFNEGYRNQSDYAGALNREIVFGQGQSFVTTNIAVLDDNAIESNERFGVVVQRNSTDSANEYLARATFTIVDDDAVTTDGVSVVVLEPSDIAGSIPYNVDALNIFPTEVASDPLFKAAVIDLANKYSVPPAYLLAVMAFESAGTFSPSIRNPFSNAVGLIQFTSIAVADWDITLDELSVMTAAEQMVWVERYLDRYIAPNSSPTVSDLYMSVLYPVAVGQPEDYVLFSPPSRAYEQNSGLDLNNDLSVTKQEAAAKVTANVSDYFLLDTHYIAATTANTPLIVRLLDSRNNTITVSQLDAAVAVFSAAVTEARIVGEGFAELRIIGGAAADAVTLGDLSATALSQSPVYFFGEAGDDQLDASALHVGVYAEGGIGDDQLIGTAFADTLLGGDGNDQLFSQSGDDTIWASAGNDVIDAGDGQDILVYQSSQQTIFSAKRQLDDSVILTTFQGTIQLKHVEQLQFEDNTALLVDALVEGLNVNVPRFNVVQGDGSTIQATPSVYVGGVTYLEYELLGDADGNVVIGSTSNDFINLLGGDDAADGGEGRDVLDGGTGSNFLTGGSGDDTFFLDGRGGTSTWSTVTDFSIGDNVTIWGWQAGQSKLIQQVDGSGVAGYKGATFHYDLNNDGDIETSITFTGWTLSNLPQSSQQTIGDLGYLLFA